MKEEIINHIYNQMDYNRPFDTLFFTREPHAEVKRMYWERYENIEYTHTFIADTLFIKWRYYHPERRYYQDSGGYHDENDIMDGLEGGVDMDPYGY
ncbi:hypothetical protein N9H15_01000 [bacterium]|nr:hypothetical protein [bacterium]